ncbi:MAG TPA: hypothetical protein VN258_07905 [Mobilitalea sp.]|nr:hypothetical protein [Mobilitalea sp.]
MNAFLKRFLSIFKIIFISVVIIFTILTGTLSTSVQNRQQCFDLRSSSIISTGISASFCLGIYSRKKE